MKINLVRRIASLEARLPPEKSYVQRILEKCTDEELDRAEAIAGKVDGGGTPTPEESAFLDDLEARYGSVQKIEQA